MKTMAIIIGLSRYIEDVDIADLVDMYELWEQRLVLKPFKYLPCLEFMGGLVLLF
jgi:hypothetical protein